TSGCGDRGVPRSAACASAFQDGAEPCPIPCSASAPQRPEQRVSKQSSALPRATTVDESSSRSPSDSGPARCQEWAWRFRPVHDTGIRCGVETEKRPDRAELHVAPYLSPRNLEESRGRSTLF